MKENIEIISRNDVATVVFKAAALSGSEEIASASEQILDYIEKNNPNLVVVDFENVKFFSSQVLGMLVNIRKRLAEHNGRLMIASINPQLYRVFRITNLDKIFQFLPDSESAVK